MLELRNIFPKSYGYSYYGPVIKEHNYIKTLEKTRNTHNQISVDKRVLNYNYSFKSFIEQSLKQYYIEELSIHENVTPVITQSWFTYSDRHEMMHEHRHSNSIVSGVFYINAIENSDELVFIEETNLYQMIDWGAYERRLTVPVKTGDLLLFRSDTEHYFNQVTHREQRISLAFNSFLEGEFGSENGATKLNLKIS